MNIFAVIFNNLKLLFFRNRFDKRITQTSELVDGYHTYKYKVNLRVNQSFSDNEIIRRYMSVDKFIPSEMMVRSLYARDCKDNIKTLVEAIKNAIELNSGFMIKDDSKLTKAIKSCYNGEIQFEDSKSNSLIVVSFKTEHKFI